jgi:hypothetical protein
MKGMVALARIAGNLPGQTGWGKVGADETARGGGNLCTGLTWAEAGCATVREKAESPIIFDG